MPMQRTRPVALAAAFALLVGVAAAVYALSVRGDSSVSLRGVSESQLDSHGVSLTPPDGDPVISREQAEAIVLNRRHGTGIRDTMLVTVVMDTDSRVTTLAWAVTIDPETVKRTPHVIRIGPIGPGERDRAPTPSPTPLNCGLRTNYAAVFVDALTAEWLLDIEETELVHPSPGETCPATPTQKRHPARPPTQSAR